MKKIMLITCGIVFNLILLAQPPQGINYQAVVRNSSGDIVSNQTVNFKFFIRTESETGTIVYTETQDILTDQYGLANLVIGSGTPVTGTFETIDWPGGNTWIEVEMDPANTYTYVSMGTEQFQSVPYALYSGSDWNASGDNLYYNDGNVGIGTSSPNAKLEVVGDVFVNNNDLGVEQSIGLGPSSPTVSLGREAGSRTMLLKSGVDGMTSGAGFKFLINDEDKLILDEDGNLGIGTTTPNNELSVLGNADISGNVGIGTTTPNNELSVSGNADISGNLGIGTTTTTNELSVLGDADISGNLGIGTKTPTNEFSVLGNADISGNVGIGTTTPTNKLSILGNADISGNVGIGTTTPTNELSILGNADISGNVGIGTTTPTNELSVSGNADISGNVGIGTSTPDAKLDVAGDLKFSDWFDQDLSPNGYAKMGSIIIQWGTYISTYDGAQYFDFPTQFDNACFSVVTQRFTANAEFILSVSGWTNTTFSINRNDAIDGSETFTWIAVGY